MAELAIKHRFRGFFPVVVDVETAGFDPKTCALLEVAMQTVEMDGNGLMHPGELISANIRPFEGSVINESNIAFLKIDPFDPARDLKDETEALTEMFKIIGKQVKKHKCKRAVLVGHNAHFDLDFINAAAARCGLEKKNPFHPFTAFDTASISALVYGQTVLLKACTAAGIAFDESHAHGAVYDTGRECELFCAACNRFTLYAGLPPTYPED